MRQLVAALCLALFFGVVVAQGMSSSVADLAAQYEAAANAGDAQAIANLFTEDGWLAENDGTVYQGRSALLQHFVEEVASQQEMELSLSLTTLETVDAGEAQIARGTWAATGSDGAEMGGGEWVALAVQENGEELIRWLISNLVLPPMEGGAPQ